MTSQQQAALAVVAKTPLHFLAAVDSVSRELYGITEYVVNRDKVAEILAVFRAGDVLADAVDMVERRLARVGG